jgi:hypothetical protein
VKTVHGLILDRIEGGRKAAASSISIPVRLQPGSEEQPLASSGAGGFGFGF